jgi:hypothetical protein
MEHEDQKCLQCGDPLGHEPVSFLDNHNRERGACHLRCVDAYHAQRKEERPAILSGRRA